MPPAPAAHIEERTGKLRSLACHQGFVGRWALQRTRRIWLWCRCSQLDTSLEPRRYREAGECPLRCPQAWVRLAPIAASTKKGAVMFTPKVAKPQTRTAASSASNLARQRSTLVGHRFGHDPVEQALFLQRTIGNQATLRLLAQQTSRQQGSATEHTTSRGASWDFSKIPLFPPERQGSSPQPNIIQRKLVVGQTNDPLEHEADRVADQVIRMAAAPEIEPVAASPQISRKCAACKAEEEQLQKKKAETSKATLGVASG